MESHDISATPCCSEEELQIRLKTLLSIPGNIETAANLMFERLLEEVLLGLAFDIHQLNRLGGIPVMTEEDIRPFTIVGSNDIDIFGQQYAKTCPECRCPVCQRKLSALKFAPHLGKCLGMGRNSSRVASQRIANNCKENAYGGTSDDDYWVAGQEKYKMNKKVEGKKKKDKNAVKKVKSQKVFNDNNHAEKVFEDCGQSAKYENLETKS